MMANASATKKLCRLRLSAISALLAVVFFSFPASAQFTPDANHRKKFNFNIGWKFYLGQPSGSPESASFNDDSWEDVCIPHTLKVVSKNLDNSNDGADQPSFHRLFGWYRKHFDAQSTWQGRKIFIDFQGVGQTAEIWVNGTRIGKYEVSGFDEFSYDITDEVNLGESNVVAVMVDHRRNSNTPPDGEMMDFILFGGMNRDVFLHITDPLHVDFPWESTTSGVTITTPTISTSSATVRVRTNVVNESSASKSVTLVSTILDADNRAVTSMTATQDIAAGDSHLFTQTSSAIANPKLWSPDSPYRYKVYTSVRDGTEPADGVDGFVTKFGMRWVEWSTSNGFSINGQSLKLFGTNRHQSWPFVGYAVPNRMHVYDAVMMKAIGYNWVRCSHYPHDPEFLDALDSLGIMALEEGPSWWSAPNNTWKNNLVTSFRKMIRLNRNRPCIILWNACINHGGCDRTLESAANEEDPTRKTGQCDIPCPMCFTQDNPPYVAPDAGVCIEYLGGDCGRSARVDREATQVSCAIKHLGFIDLARATADNSGIAHWCGFDYNTFFNQDEKNLNHEGIIDIVRLPKFFYHCIRAELTEEPFIFIANYWLQDSPRDVTVFSNCEEVELFVNGTSRGTARPSTGSGRNDLLHAPFEFSNQTFAAGELKAVGKINGEIAATHIVNTPGSAASIRLEADPPNLIADGSDFTRIIASVVDANGTVVPTATNSITFSESGSARLVGDNPSAAGAGLTVILLQAGLTTGTATVTATAGSLQSNSLEVPIVERPPDEIPVDPTYCIMPNSIPVLKAISTTPKVWVTGDRFQVPSVKGKDVLHIELYDLHGKLLKTMRVKSGTMVDAAHNNLFHHGIILVRIRDTIY